MYQARPIEAPEPPGPLILVVDDYEANRELYAEYLRHCGYRVVEACDGEEAIAKAAALHPDLIVMDLGLPHLDGWEATRQLKHDRELCDIPIVVVSGYTQTRHQEAARAAGADAFLPKPCLSELVVELKRLLHPAPAIA